MGNLVPLDLQQQTAIADLQQPGGLAAVPTGASKGSLDRFDLGPSPQRAQREIVAVVRGFRTVGLSTSVSQMLRPFGADRNGFVDILNQVLVTRAFARGLHV
jgi:hypothetical protein